MTNLSDSQIIRGDFSQAQIANLEERLIELFFARAKEQGKRIDFETDAIVYLEKKDNGLVFDGPNYVLLADKERAIVDITPVVYHCIDLPEGLQYAKIMQQRGYLPISERPSIS